MPASRRLRQRRRRFRAHRIGQKQMAGEPAGDGECCECRARRDGSGLSTRIADLPGHEIMPANDDVLPLDHAGEAFARRFPHVLRE